MKVTKYHIIYISNVTITWINRILKVNMHHIKFILYRTTTQIISKNYRCPRIPQDVRWCPRMYHDVPRSPTVSHGVQLCPRCPTPSNVVQRRPKSSNGVPRYPTLQSSLDHPKFFSRHLEIQTGLLRSS